MGKPKSTAVKGDYTNRFKKGNFQGYPAFLKATGRKNTKKTRDELRSIPSYSLFQPVKPHYPTRMTFVPLPNYTFGFDLMSVQNVAHVNKGINYILICIDLFSRKLFTAFLKTKDMNAVEAGIRKVLKKAGQTPLYALCDVGGEFWNWKVEALFKNLNVHPYVVRTKQKCSICERVIQVQMSSY